MSDLILIRHGETDGNRERGESTRHFHARCLAAIRELAGKCAGRTASAVIRGGVLEMFSGVPAGGAWTARGWPRFPMPASTASA